MGFYNNINDIIIMLEGYLDKLPFREVTTALKLEERERNFPHIIILPKKEIIENTLISKDYSNCEFTVDLVIEVRNIKRKLGLLNY